MEIKIRIDDVSFVIMSAGKSFVIRSIA